MQGQINPIQHPVMTDVQKRLQRVEEQSASRSVEVALARRDIQDIKGDLEEIKGYFNKLFWTIVSAFAGTLVTGATTFVLTGGLNLIN